MMGRTILYAGLISVMTLLNACVSKGKYTRLDARATNHEMENRQLKGRIARLEAQNKELEEKGRELAEAKEDALNVLNEELQKKTIALEEMNKRVAELEAQLQSRQDTAAPCDYPECRMSIK